MRHLAAQTVTRSGAQPLLAPEECRESAGHGRAPAAVSSTPADGKARLRCRAHLFGSRVGLRASLRLLSGHTPVRSRSKHCRRIRVSGETGDPPVKTGDHRSTGDFRSQFMVLSANDIEEHPILAASPKQEDRVRVLER
ncbi:hypothetical protein NDU88_003257 [Pleurodeles waltl]|uniref:Uncharacterized protein n=1 Tax=Pleurodeles waltl TaxID=8319 RepID=A0AAV7SE03_PLEWA|nr:hypothetical protein NDU88_003257 [Pleurodeles waltl]